MPERGHRTPMNARSTTTLTIMRGTIMAGTPMDKEDRASCHNDVSLVVACRLKD
jgi:hypothetical protein